MLKVQGDIAPLENALGHRFENRELLMQALTHSSAAAEVPTLTCNERLEFLGDTVLQMVVTDYIFRHYPQIPEGQLTRMRAAAVSEPSLAKLAETLNLGEYLIMGKGAGTRNGRHLPSVLSDAMEAVVAAIYLEAGFAPCQKLLLPALIPVLEANRASGGRDEKTMLQEKLQVNGTVEIRYELIGQEGPPHDRTFTMAVFCDGKELARGTGKSKKAAQKAAAACALEAMDKEESH